MFNFIEFLKIAVPTLVAMLPFVMGLVTFWGKLGLKGVYQFVSSMLTGLVLGGATMFFQAPPKDAAGWFAIVVFGLLTGLAASGCYEVVKAASEKAITE